MKEVVRSYCIFIFLGRPRKTLPLLSRILKAPVIWFSSRFSHLMLLPSVTRRPLPSAQLHLLWELTALPARYEGKMLTLVPLTPEMRDFVRQNETILSENYRIKEVL